MKINTPIISTLLIIFSSFYINTFYGQNTPKKGHIIVEKVVKTKKDSAGKITETKTIQRISIDSLRMDIDEGFINDSFDLSIQADTVQSFISIWPNRSLVIIDNDTLFPSPKKKNKKSPVILNEGGFMLGFASLQRDNVTGISAEFPELKNNSSMHIGFNNEWGIKTFSGNWRLWTGIQYDILNYRFSNSNVRLQADQSVFTTSLDSGNNSAKSKIVVNYIGIPISFGYQSKAKDADEGFSIRAGVVAGYRVRTHTKVKLDNDKTTKDFDDFNMNDFLITPFVQASYNNVGIYFRYNTSMLFKDNQGPRYTGMQFGLVFQ
ncbi:MAG: outer membrane beta-barrel protein [Sphingomonadales bacterium]